MYVCMYVYVCIYIYISIYIYMCTYIYIYIYIYIVCVCVYIFINGYVGYPVQPILKLNYNSILFQCKKNCLNLNVMYH